jgi:hypothetical protein
MGITDRIPALKWLRGYDRGVLLADAVAAVIVTIMLIPQSLAYAMLAGLPPERRASMRASPRWCSMRCSAAAACWLWVRSP